VRGRSRPYPAPPIESRLQRYAAPSSQSFWAANVLAGLVTSALERSPPDALAMSDDLPPPNTQRWVVRRKAAVIMAVRSGHITLEEALRRYNRDVPRYRGLMKRLFSSTALALVLAGPALAQSISVSPVTVSPGATLTVVATDAAATVYNDEEIQNSSNALVSWDYMNGTQTAPAQPLTNATFNVTAPTVPGPYTIYLLRNGASAVAQEGFTVTPPSIACDIGPSVTAIPAAAQAAGLTHCAANFDFSQAAYSIPAYNPTGDAGSWANCMGENSGLPGVMWHGGSGGIAEVSPCDIKQKADPLDGSTVMNFEWRPVRPFQKGGGQANQVSLMTWNQYTGTPALTVGNYYVETTNRLESSCPSGSCPPNSGGPNDVYMYPTPGSYGTEIDIQEFQTNALNGASGTGVAAGYCGYSNGGNPCWSNWQSANPITGISNYSNLTFHTYGALSTSDGKTDKRVCMYIDGVLQNKAGCLVEQGSSAGVNDTNFLTRNMVVAGASSNLGTAGLPIEFNVKNIVVWTCAGYQQTGAAGMCNGTTLSKTTLGTGQTLAYYH